MSSKRLTFFCSTIDTLLLKAKFRHMILRLTVYQNRTVIAEVNIIAAIKSFILLRNRFKSKIHVGSTSYRYCLWFMDKNELKTVN